MKYIEESIKLLQDYKNEFNNNNDFLKHPPYETSKKLAILLNNSLLKGEFSYKEFKTKVDDIYNLINTEIRGRLLISYQEQSIGELNDKNNPVKNYWNDFNKYFVYYSNTWKNILDYTYTDYQNRKQNNSIYLLENIFNSLNLDDDELPLLRLLIINYNLIYIDINYAFKLEIINQLIVAFNNIKYYKNRYVEDEKEIIEKLEVKIHLLLYKIHLRILILRSENNSRNIELLSELPLGIIEKYINEIKMNGNRNDISDLIHYCEYHYSSSVKGIRDYDSFININEYLKLHKKVKEIKDFNGIGNTVNELKQLYETYNNNFQNFKEDIIIYNTNYNYVFNNYISMRIKDLIKDITNYDVNQLIEQIEAIDKEIHKIQRETNIYNFFPYRKILELIYQLLTSKKNEFHDSSDNVRLNKIETLLNTSSQQYYHNMNWCKERNFQHFILSPQNSSYNDIFIYSSFVVPIAFDAEKNNFKEISKKINQLIIDINNSVTYKNELESFDNLIKQTKKELNENKKQTIETVTVFTALIAILTGFLVNSKPNEYMSFIGFLSISILLILFIFMIIFIINRNEIINSKLLSKNNIFIIFISILLSVFANYMLNIIIL